MVKVNQVRVNYMPMSKTKLNWNICHKERSDNFYSRIKNIQFFKKDISQCIILAFLGIIRQHELTTLTEVFLGLK